MTRTVDPDRLFHDPDDTRTRLAERLPEKWRWRIANALNRLPGMCWSSLADWFLFPWSARLRHTYTAADCAARANGGGCYCGKTGWPKGYSATNLPPAEAVQERRS